MIDEVRDVLSAVGRGDLLETVDALQRENAALKRTIDRLREWMGEYPNDKYTGAWWQQELDRLLALAPSAAPGEGETR